ncbi:MAG: Gfo/Idh/MocA family oxidoreductase [Pseudomonadota bacterium]
MTRLLVAGTGLIGHRHLAHIVEHPALSLAGIVDPVEANRTMADAPGFAAIEDVDVEADGIVIATPTASHAPLAAAAAARGWHALVEKPLAESLASADAMIAAAAAANVALLVGHHRRHHPKVAKLKEILASGRIGRPVVAMMMWAMRKPDDYFDVDWRAGLNGAPVKQNLIHDVDMLRWFFGDVTGVAGAGGNPIRGEARTESGGAVLTFDSGVTATIAFADSTPTPWGFEAGTGESPAIPKTGQNSLYVACSDGAVEFPSLTVWSGASTWNEEPTPSREDAEEAIPLVRQLEHFADVIAGRAAPLVSGEEGRRTLDATLRIEAATLPVGVTV